MPTIAPDCSADCLAADLGQIPQSAFRCPAFYYIVEEVMVVALHQHRLIRRRKETKRSGQQ